MTRNPMQYKLIWLEREFHVPLSNFIQTEILARMLFEYIHFDCSFFNRRPTLYKVDFCHLTFCFQKLLEYFVDHLLAMNVNW